MIALISALSRFRYIGDGCIILDYAIKYGTIRLWLGDAKPPEGDEASPQETIYLKLIHTNHPAKP